MLQHNCMQLTWTAQVLYKIPIHIQNSACATGTTQGISDRFGAFGPMSESYPCSDVRSVPSLSSRCWAVHECQAHHTRVPTRLYSLSISAGFDLPQYLTIPSMSQSRIRPMIFIVLVSQEVHTQGHSQHHLFLPEISFTSTTSPQRLQRHLGQQTPLLLGLRSPALFLFGLGQSRLCLLCGHLISSLHCHLLSNPPCLCSEAKPLHA